MKEFRSFLAPQIRHFIRYRQASQRWNDSSYEENLMLFDRYCLENYPGDTMLTQEMVDGWCRQRHTEANNLFFVKHFSLKKASKFPFFSKGYSLLSAGLLESPQAAL